MKALSGEEPISPRWGYKFKYNGRNFIEMRARHDYFIFKYKVEGDWKSSTHIKSIDDIKIMKDSVRTAFELVGGQFKEELFNI